MKLSFVIAIFAWMSFFGFLWVAVLLPDFKDGAKFGLIVSFTIAFIATIFQTEGGEKK